MSRLYLRLCESFAPALTFLRSGLGSLTWRKEDTVKCFLFFIYSCLYLSLDEGREWGFFQFCRQTGSRYDFGLVIMVMGSIWEHVKKKLCIRVFLYPVSKKTHCNVMCWYWITSQSEDLSKQLLASSLLTKAELTFFREIPPDQKIAWHLQHG